MDGIVSPPIIPPRRGPRYGPCTRLPSLPGRSLRLIPSGCAVPALGSGRMIVKLPDFLHDRDGEIRLVGHRISLFELLGFYREGYPAEMLREQFPTLPMDLIHKTLGFYWEHRAELDAELERIRGRLDSARVSGEQLDLAGLRARLASKA